MAAIIVRFVDKETLSKRMDQTRKANEAYRRFRIWEDGEIAKARRRNRKTLRGVTVNGLEKRHVN